MGAIKNKNSELKNSDRLYARYSGVPIVYVESSEDQHVFGECWFREDASRIEFKSVGKRNDNVESTSGCKAVIAAVNDERKSSNPAWGIVDRDAVLNAPCWLELLHETDDSQFDEARPFGVHVKILCRWEMESYLIDAAFIEKCRSEMKMSRSRSDAEVWDELLIDCDALIPHAALNAFRHEVRKKGFDDGWTNKISKRSDVQNKLVEPVLVKMREDHPACNERYDFFLQCSDAFDIPGESNSARVGSLLRRVHGKAVLSRFESRHGVTRLKGQLAARIKEGNRVPSELKDFVARVLRGDR